VQTTVLPYRVDAGVKTPGLARLPAVDQPTRIVLVALSSALVLHGSLTLADPGVGIVEDASGTIFFTDLQRVWMIDADDRLAIAVEGVHTHELGLDGDGNLIGEHLEFLGGERWRHRVWQRTPRGEVSDVVAPRDGFLNDRGFARDSTGATYWIDVEARPRRVRRRSAAGEITPIGPELSQPGRLTVDPDGTVFMIDANKLVSISPTGEVRTDDLGASLRRTPGTVTHDVMGIWRDRRGASSVATAATASTWLAVAAERRVLRIGADGARAEAATVPTPWNPSGGTFDRRGRLWLLEFDSGAAVRVRRLVRDGAVFREDRVFRLPPQVSKP
jgi:hypothetical protein